MNPNLYPNHNHNPNTNPQERQDAPRSRPGAAQEPPRSRPGAAKPPGAPKCSKTIIFKLFRTSFRPQAPRNSLPFQQ